MSAQPAGEEIFHSGALPARVAVALAALRIRTRLARPDRKIHGRRSPVPSGRFADRARYRASRISSSTFRQTAGSRSILA